MSFVDKKTISVFAIFTIVIIFSVVITAIVERPISKPSFPEVVTVGPLWNTNTWSCTSDSDFIIHGTIRSLPDARMTVSISGLGAQTLYTFVPSNLYSFTVGSPAGHTMSISKTGTITGWLTLETKEGSIASCKPV